VESEDAPQLIAAHFSFMQVALTIAGSDSGGGAGIQADLKTFHRFGVFGTSAITAITAQNTLGVVDWEAVPASLVRALIDAVASDLHPAAIKSGMLANHAVISAVAAGIRENRLDNYVLDPVMVATSGDLLIERDAVAAIVGELMPLAAVITPNIHEAAVLAGIDVRNTDEMKEAASILFAKGARCILIKGGDAPGGSKGVIVDLLYDGTFTAYEHARIDSTSTHGTGCTLSAAIAARLALGDGLQDAIGAAIDYVQEAIRTAPGLGGGNGPLNHFGDGSAETNSLTSA
jgi:hydroxymethylpyrimidine/phosphomethylpyrimidine kinase